MSNRVAIVGSRDFTNEYGVRNYVRALATDVEVVSGGAVGVDSWAVDEAQKRGLTCRVFPPDYVKYSRWVAPKVRNTEIADYADAAVAFWSGRDGGTTDVVGKLVLRGKPVEVRR